MPPRPRGKGRQRRYDEIIAILAASAADHPPGDLAARFGVSPSTIYRIKKRYTHHKVKEHGVELPPHPAQVRAKLEARLDPEAQAMLKEGLSRRDKDGRRGKGRP